MLEAGSALAEALPGFRPRAEQLAMAEAVAAALAERGRLVVEAGTGTGKTFAYLIPALYSGAKVIVSTGTRRTSCSTATCRSLARRSGDRCASRC
jgi:ATP-dependent DNA helicase DinG